MDLNTSKGTSAVMALMTAKRRRMVKAAAADISPAMAATVYNEIPQGELAHNKFHVYVAGRGGR
jgi:hypothetical protein